ncbi:DUF4347 domain-containing protein [Oculatella sp. LEGE 06141]|uniref:DUF4347 domain-containing protein n=1 Tax=Oculatella sp. LEGE 06141 TaxID=1828648 RepID=UPI001882B0EB|nr:DUF4347 domain-containing protein [Oculatella sp. LEGE 06141]MBE9182897.1 DUF4347 domain-containing protein [Oculatella sp. LEGE 06141]
MTSLSIPSSLIVVDPRVENYLKLIENINPDAEILILDESQNGVEQITNALVNHNEVSNLHIISHGQSGFLQLGDTQLSAATLSHYAESLKQWSVALTSNADILLYGCDVAAGEDGAGFIEALSAITNADVAASTDLTGSTALGGDWTLEYTAGQIESPSIVQAEAMEVYDAVLQTEVLFTETFTNSEVAGEWIYGTGPKAGQTTPFLTARDTRQPSPGGLLGVGGEALDEPGQGTLRLTDAEREENSYVIYNTPFSSNAGLSITFDTFAYSGTGADGIGFFLIDGSTSPQVSGGLGGSFGYAPRNIQGVPGIEGGYLGIAIDEYGNFSSPEITPQGQQKTTGPGRIPNAISVRGSEATNYAYLTGTEPLPAPLDFPDITNREEARRRINVDLTRSGLLTVKVDLNQDNDYNDPGELAIDSFNTIAANSTVPETFKFGFSGTSGSQTNIHEIRNLVIETISAPPEVDNATLRLNQGETKPVTGLNATDSDGTIASYFITTLPAANAGTLFLGDPAQGGTPVAENQEILPSQIDQIFFQSTSNFFGNASFTYNAVDNTGSIDNTPGTVRVTVQAVAGSGGRPPIDPNCLPGENLRGTNRRDRIEGTENSDVIRGLRGNDVLLGLACGDILRGNRGRDRLVGDGGNDLLIGNQDNDILRGGNGIDFLFGNLGNDDLNAGFGDDRLDGGYGDDRLRGVRGNDTIAGNNGDDTIDGGAGNDIIEGDRGRDTIQGGGNNDFVKGRQDDDQISGNRGNDRLFGNLGDDVLNGNRGNDRLNGGVGDDKLFGNQGRDRLVGGGGNDTLYGNRGRDTLIGGAGDDLIVGGPERDILSGGAGADRFFFLGGTQADALKQSIGAAPDVTDFNYSEGDKFLLSYENNLGKLIRPSGLFNAGVVAGRNIIRAARTAYRDKDQQANGRQRLNQDEAVFFQWQDRAYLAVNNNVPGYGFNDLTVGVTGIQLKPGDNASGSLNVADYFATNPIQGIG